MTDLAELLLLIFGGALLVVMVPVLVAGALSLMMAMAAALVIVPLSLVLCLPLPFPRRVEALRPGLVPGRSRGGCVGGPARDGVFGTTLRTGPRRSRWPSRRRAALRRAVDRDDADAVERLIGEGTDIGMWTREGLGLLHLAARSGSDRMVSVLLAAGADPDAPEDRGGRTALHFAARRTGTGPLEEMLAAGADVRARDCDGWEPLHYAAHWGRADAAAMLLAAGADPLARTGPADGEGPTDGMTALHAGAASETPEVSDLLLAHLEARPGGGVAAALTAYDARGRTALHHVAAHGSAATVGALLARDSAVAERVNRDGQTALHVAAARGDGPVLAALIAAMAGIDATIDQQDDEGRSALHLAAERGCAGSVGMLLAAGAHPGVKTIRCETACATARKGGAMAAERARTIALLEDAAPEPLPGKDE